MSQDRHNAETSFKHANRKMLAVVRNLLQGSNQVDLKALRRERHDQIIRNNDISLR